MKFNTKKIILLTCLTVLAFGPFSAKASGYLNIIKNTTRNVDETFSFKVSGTESSNKNITTSNSIGQTSFTLDAGTYNITENLLDGWNLDEAYCDNGTFNNDRSVYNITVTDSQTVNCVFVGSPKAILQITKYSTDGIYGVFNLKLLNKTSSEITTYPITSGFTAPQTFRLALEPGPYSLTENIPDGWNLDDAYCDDGSLTNSINPSNMDIQPVKTTNCTFTNSLINPPQAFLKIFANTTDQISGTFSFNVTGPTNSSPIVKSYHGSGSSKIAVDSGTYNVTENITNGWSIDSVTCDSGTPNQNNDGVSDITISAGQTINCYFNNKWFARRGFLNIKKNTTDEMSGTFNFTVNGPIFSQITSVEAYSGAGGIIIDLDEGAYSVTENSKPYWNLISSECNNGDPTNFTITAGQTTVCTFNDSPKAILQIKKVTAGNLSYNYEKFNYKITSGTFSKNASLYAYSDSQGSNTPAKIALNPGTYNVTENANPNWNFFSATCDNGTPQGNGVSGVAISAGQTINCTFTNEAKAAIKIIKNTTNGDGNFSYQISNPNSLIKTNLSTYYGTGSARVAVDPGKYSVTEDPKTAWTMNSNSCSGPFTINKSPTTIEDDEMIGTAQWQNPSNAASNNDSYATTDLSDTNSGEETYAISHYLKAINFGFNIPNDATIQGIEVDIKRKAGSLDNGNIVDNKINIVVGGGIGFVNEAHLLEFWPEENSSVHYGDSNDLWGTTPKPADINSSDFGIAISTGLVKTDNENEASAQASIDSIKITVTYTTTITVVDGQTTECTFDNSRTSLKIIQNIQGENRKFDYFISPTPSKFSLWDNSSTPTNTASTELFLDPGNYSVAQDLPNDWVVSISCDNGGSYTSGENTVSNITLTAGNTTTCTFNDYQKGTLKIVKNSSSAGVFNFNISPTPFTAIISTSNSVGAFGNGVITASTEITGLDPRITYNVAEDIQPGWDLLSSVCDNGDPSNLTISPGGTTTCTFDNDNIGTLKVIANAAGGDLGIGYAIYKVNQNSLFHVRSGSLTTTLGAGSDEIPLESDIYSISSGLSTVTTLQFYIDWEFVSISCDHEVANTNSTTVQTTARFKILRGETTTCNINYQKRGSLIIRKTIQDTDIYDLTGFIININPTPLVATVPAASDLEGVSNIPLSPGTYSIAENPPPGWNLVSSSCGSSFTISPGQTTTCYFVNSKTPSPDLQCPGLQCINGACVRCNDTSCINEPNCSSVGQNCTPSFPTTYGSGSLKVVLDDIGGQSNASFKLYKKDEIQDISPGGTTTLPSLFGGPLYRFLNYYVVENIDENSSWIPYYAFCDRQSGFVINQIGGVNQWGLSSFGTSFYSASADNSYSIGLPFNILDGTTTTCTFGNYLPAYININVNVSDGDGSFRYKVSKDIGPGPLSTFLGYISYHPSLDLLNIANGVIATTNGQGSVRVPVLPGAKYYVSVSPSSQPFTILNNNFNNNYDLMQFNSASCDNGTPIQSTVKDVTTTGGQTVNCDFNNTSIKQSYIKIKTTATGGNDAFTYSNIFNNYSHQNINIKTTDGTGSSKLITVNPGSNNTIKESLPSGWKEDSFTCDQYTTTRHTPSQVENETDELFHIDDNIYTLNYPRFATSFDPIDWTDLSNAKEEDSLYVKAILDDNIGGTNYLKATNFGFNIPNNATINGIQVNIKANRKIGAGQYTEVRLVKNGEIRPFTTNWSYWLQGLLDSFDYGSPSDLWGTTLTPADVNSNNFGIAIKATGYNDNVLVDQITMNVTYTTSENQTHSIPIITSTPNIDGSIQYKNIFVTAGETLTCNSHVSYDPVKDSRINLGLDTSKNLKIFNNSTNIQAGDGTYNYNISNSPPASDTLKLANIVTLKTNSGAGSVKMNVRSNSSISNFFSDKPIVYYSDYIYQSAPSGWRVKNVSCMLPNTATHTAGTIEDESSVGSTEWDNSSDATYSDNTYATTKLDNTNDESHYIKASKFEFSIPDNAVIKGIEVNIKKKGTQVDGGIIDNNVSLVKGGVVQSVNKKNNDVWPVEEDTSTYGGSEDLWGINLTPGDINSSDFGVALSAKLYKDNTSTSDGKAYVNQITLTVTYEIAGQRIDTSSDLITCTFTNSPNICGVFTNDGGDRYKFQPELLPIGQ